MSDVHQPATLLTPKRSQARSWGLQAWRKPPAASTPLPRETSLNTCGRGEPPIEHTPIPLKGGRAWPSRRHSAALPAAVIPSPPPPGRRPCGTRLATLSPPTQRRHPVWFSFSPKIIHRGLKVSRPSSLRSSTPNKKNGSLLPHPQLTPFLFGFEPGHTPPAD
jgi:hypothetical protein